MNKGDIIKSVEDAILCCTDPLGATTEFIALQTGHNLRTVRRSLHKLMHERRVKTVFDACGWNQKHYFSSPEDRDIAKVTLDEMRIEKVADIKREKVKYQQARYLKIKSAKKESRAGEVAEKKKLRESALKAPKAANLRKAGSASRPIPKPIAGGPARIPGEPDTSNAKWTYGKKPPEQTYHTNTHSRFG